MTTKQMMFVMMIFISMNSFTFTTIEASEPKNFVFNNGMNTQIGGNIIHRRLCAMWRRSQPTSVFKHTRVVMLNKNKRLQEIGTLEEISKNASFVVSDQYDNLSKHGEMNNAIYCDNVEQKLDYDDKLCNVGAIIFGTRDLKYCSLFKEYLEK